MFSSNDYFSSLPEQKNIFCTALEYAWSLPGLPGPEGSAEPAGYRDLQGSLGNCRVPGLRESPTSTGA